MPPEISKGDRVRITYPNGFFREGLVVSTDDTSRPGNPPIWYLEIEIDGKVYYWKQDIDGGKVEKIED